MANGSSPDRVTEEEGALGHLAFVFGVSAACRISARAWLHVKERERDSVTKSSVSCSYRSTHSIISN